MKEQTPITAEEFFKNHDFNDGRIADKHDKIIAKFDYYDLIEFAESFANLKSKAKVLEALEREVIDSHKHGEVCKKGIGSLTTRAVEYYETEVKAKYKL